MKLTSVRDIQMGGEIRETSVQGVKYLTRSDFIMRGTYAENTATGETKMIKDGGYVSNDLSLRKAIATAFGLESFRK